MCVCCSRRELVAGTVSVVFLGPAVSIAKATTEKYICGFNDQKDYHKTIQTRRSIPDGNSKYHDALISELQSILKIIPADPGFQYVDSDNAHATSEPFYPNTRGTVMIGVRLMNQLLEANDGGISVAGVLAHECAHIFQFASPGLAERLEWPTRVFLELHADALAGYYLAKKIGTSTKLLGVMHRHLQLFGTYNSNDPAYHGMPGHRSAALDTGYEMSRNGMSFENASREAERYVKTLVMRPKS